MSTSPHPDKPADKADGAFGKRVRSAVFWRSGSQIISQMVMWGSTLAVIRILDPSDYGLFAMTQTVIVFLDFLNGYGFASALIQSKDVTRHQIRQAFGLLIMLNAILAIIQIFSAPLIAAYYGHAIIADMLRVQALIFLATPFIVVPEVLMSRKLDFKRQAVANLAASVAGAVTAISCALSGWGVWTLVAAPIALFWVRAIGLLIAARFWVWPSFDFRGTRHILSFGSTILVAQLFWIIQSQSDIFIGGRILEPHELGLYAEALFLALVFTSKFVPPLNQVAFPAYAQIQSDPSAVNWSFRKAMRLIMLIAAPLYVGLAVTAEPLVLTLFGEKWAGMVPFLQIFACAMPLLAMQILYAPAINALGRPRVTLGNAAFGGFLMPISFIIGIQWGVMGLALSWLVAVPLLTAFTIWRSSPVIGVSAYEAIAAMLPGLGCALIMGVVVWQMDNQIAIFWPSAMASDSVSAAFRLAALVAIGGVSYLLLLRVLAPNTLHEVIRLVIKRRSPDGEISAA